MVSSVNDILLHQHDDPVGHGHYSVIESDASFSLQLKNDLFDHDHRKEIGKSLIKMTLTIF